MAVQALPKIVRFSGIVDSPGASCPHCGATGRFIHRFTTEDGRDLGAMSGCVKLFPCSPIAWVEAEIQKKAVKLAEDGRKLNRWDDAILTACAAFFLGVADEATTLREIRLQKSAASAWRSRRFGR